MIDEKKIHSLVAEKISGTENYIVEINISVANKITILLDNEKGLSINDCIAISRHVEGNLDREAEDFDLTVSSPGLDQPFKVLRQYIKNIGKQVQVLTKEGKRITGKLLAANKDGIEIEERSKQKVEGKKSRQLTVTKLYFSFDQIKETKIVLSF